MKSPSRAQPDHVADATEPLEAVEAFSARLREFRDRQSDEALRDSYQAALDRLETLAQQLKEATARPRRTMGLPHSEKESGKGRARKILEEAGLDAAWALYTGGATDGREEGIITDIVDRLVQYGSLSEKQIEFIRKLLRDIDGRAEHNAKPRSTTGLPTQAVEAGARKAEAVLEEAGLGAAWAIYTGAASDRREEQIIKDIVQRLVQYGSLSEKQVRFVGKLLRDIESRAEGERAGAEKPEPPHRALPLGPVVIARKPRRR